MVKCEELNMKSDDYIAPNPEFFAKMDKYNVSASQNES